MKQLVNSYDLLSNEIVDGSFNKLNDFCAEKIKSSKCQNFYNRLLNEKDGFYICPYGFNCIKNGNKVHNCILLKENYINKKMKDKKSIEQKIFTKNEIVDMLQIDSENNQFINNYELLYKSMSDFLHDITKVSKMIDNYSKAITKTDLRKKDVSKLESIYHLTGFINKRIELYRMTSNPEIIKVGRKRKVDVYKFWDIYRYIFKDFCHDSNLSIDMKIYNVKGIEENGKKIYFFANDSITMLPYLLLDNAIKYSEKNSIIKVKFYQDNSILNKITIASKPSYPITDNPNLFFERGYRGANNISKSSGSGLGLNIVKQICDYNDINVQISIDNSETEDQEFIVILDF